MSRFGKGLASMKNLLSTLFNAGEFTALLNGIAAALCAAGSYMHAARSVIPGITEDPILNGHLSGEHYQVGPL